MFVTGVGLRVAVQLEQRFVVHPVPVVRQHIDRHEHLLVDVQDAFSVRMVVRLGNAFEHPHRAQFPRIDRIPGAAAAEGRTGDLGADRSEHQPRAQQPPRAGTDVARVAEEVLVQKARVECCVLVPHDQLADLAAGRGVRPVRILGAVPGVAVLEAHGVLQVERGQDVEEFFLHDPVLLPAVGLGAGTVHTLGQHVVILELAVRGAGFFDQAEGVPYLDGVAEVAVTHVPGRLHPGLRVRGVEHGKGQAGYVAVQFAVVPEANLPCVPAGGVDICLADRQIGRLLDVEGELAGLDLVQNLRRQVVLRGVPRVRGDGSAGLEVAQRRLFDSIRIERSSDRVLIDFGLVGRGRPPAYQQAGEDARPHVFRHFTPPVSLVTDVLCIRDAGVKRPYPRESLFEVRLLRWGGHDDDILLKSLESDGGRMCPFCPARAEPLPEGRRIARCRLRPVHWPPEAEYARSCPTVALHRRSLYADRP